MIFYDFWVVFLFIGASPVFYIRSPWGGVLGDPISEMGPRLEFRGGEKLEIY